MANRSLNKVTLIGNVVRDPEISTTTHGSTKASFTVATNRSWTTESGETKEETEYHDIVAWQKLAEICEQILAKGRRVYVEGRISTRKWTDNEGRNRKDTEIVLEELIALSFPRGAEEDDSSSQPSDDLPF